MVQKYCGTDLHLMRKENVTLEFNYMMEIHMYLEINLQIFIMMNSKWLVPLASENHMQESRPSISLISHLFLISWDYHKNKEHTGYLTSNCDVCMSWCGRDTYLGFNILCYRQELRQLVGVYKVNQKRKNTV